MTASDQRVKAVEAAGLLTGLLFIFSGVSKALDATLFAQTIGSYGFPQFQWLSPVIIMAEALLGMCLVFGIRHRWMALAGAVMVAFFTSVYSYALFFHGVTDCGCFGSFSALNTSPLFLYAKNAVLLCLLVWVCLKGANDVPRAHWVYVAVVLLTGGVGFLSGNTYKTEHKMRLRKHPIALHDSRLSDFVELSPDSSYVVFVFSYTCPHCLDCMGNVNGYERFGVADHVIGLALGDAGQEARFKQCTSVDFPVHNHSMELMDLTTSYPKLYYVEGDSIRLSWSGEMPSACRLKEILGKAQQPVL